MTNYNIYRDQMVLIQDNIQIISPLSNADISNDPLLLQILELNAEQLMHFLEDEILENPFIELDYSTEQYLPAIDKRAEHREQDSVRIVGSQSLESYLFEQIMLYRQTSIRDVMIQLVNFLDEKGYLPYTYQELSVKLAMDEMIVLDAMTLMKQLEPAGIAAYDLREALMLQTERDAHAPNMAYYLLENHYEAIANEDVETIVADTHLTMNEIDTSMNYYLTLRRNPASLFDRGARIQLIPDVTLQVSEEQLILRYNSQYYPKIYFNKEYFHEMSIVDDSEVQNFINGKDKEYTHLEQILIQREELVMQVVQGLVIGQRAFFQGDITEPQSLSITQLAKETGFSEPLIYRIIENKNISFKEHVYALTDFINFAAMEGRTGLTAQTIKYRIRDIIENSAQHLSAEEIVKKLQTLNILITPEIVRSYRQSLGL